MPKVVPSTIIGNLTRANVLHAVDILYSISSEEVDKEVMLLRGPPPQSLTFCIIWLVIFAFSWDETEEEGSDRRSLLRHVLRNKTAILKTKYIAEYDINVLFLRLDWRISDLSLDLFTALRILETQTSGHSRLHFVRKFSRHGLSDCKSEQCSSGDGIQTLL